MEDQAFLKQVQNKIISKETKDDTKAISNFQMDDIVAQVNEEKVKECALLSKPSYQRRVKERLIDTKIIKRPLSVMRVAKRSNSINGKDLVGNVSKKYVRND